jgi:DNA-binding response OmpR family regulator
MSNQSTSFQIEEVHKKVILVEDNKAEADLTRIIYKEQSISCDIVHCGNGEEFITFLDTADTSEISYVLLDLNMPRLNGYEVLEYLSQNEAWKTLVVIVFSSSQNTKDVELCYELGAKAYVTKPMDLAELERTILSIHNFWSETNLTPQN